MTSVPTPTFGPLGFIVPQEEAILAGVTTDINQAFGGNLNPAVNTPQGQLASSQAGIIGNVNDTFLYMTNQFNPAYSVGRWQDGIGYIYFIERNPALPTVVLATCSGLPGVDIVAGALAQATDGNLYTCTTPGVIGAGGTCTATFTCNVPGAIPCVANSLTTIYQSILGWDSITNPADGVIGQDVETPQQFEARRFASVAGNSLGALSSVYGAVLGVPGVLDAYVTENPTGSPVTVGGVTLAANSLYVCVVGGTSTNIANAIFTKKAPGCAMTGGTSVTVYDTNYEMPQPSYTIKYQTPNPLAVIFAVNIANNSQVPSTATTLIQNAIVAAFAGEDGGPRARIGAELFASRFYAPVAALGSWVQIISIQIGCQNNSTAHCAAGSISGTAFTESGGTTGTFAIGQTLVDASGTILPGTVIASGTSPNWVVNNSQTVASEVIYGILAGQNDITAQINQSPNLDPANIVVTLT
jgi:hypothetical protein